MDKQISPYDALKLESQLCFPLYACAKEVVRKYKPFLDALGITYTQYIVMMVLWEQRQLSVKELGAYLFLDYGTLSPVLKKMEAAGLLQRLRDKQDERSVTILLTPKGMALREKAVEIPAKMGSCIGLDGAEAGELYRLLYKLLGKLGVGDADNGCP